MAVRCANQYTKQVVEGCLTDGEIDKLQRYYGQKLRENTSDIKRMKRAIWSVYFHKLSTDKTPQHNLCSTGEESWCGFRRAEATKGTYKHEHSLPSAAMKVINP